MRLFRVGRVYFIVWYHDHQYLFPSFESVVYIGKNLRNDKSDVWYFQDIDSYMELGRYPRVPKRSKPEIHLHKFRAVDLDLVAEGSGRILDAAELIAEVSQWRSRAAGARRRKDRKA